MLALMADTVPLLGQVVVQHSTPEDHTATGRGGAAATNAHSKPAAIARASTTGDAGVQAVLGPSLLAVLFRQLPRLLRVAQPWHALSLASLSVVEALLVARTGKVTGSFYRVLGDRDPGGLWHIVWQAACIYMLTACVQATSHWLSELTAARARLRVTGWLQRCYCNFAAFAKLPAHVDNPDQRIASDAELWAAQLGALAPIFAAAPLKVVFYTRWTMQLTSLPAVAVVYAFFVISSLLQWELVEPIAEAVFCQEALEGNLRTAHARLRSRASEAALSRGGPAEQEVLQRKLGEAVRNQQRLAAWHGLQAALTKALGYGGALISYVAVGVAIFNSPATDDKGGATAERVANGCFATIMLISSFGDMVSASERISSLAGLTSRLHRLAEELQTLQLSESEQAGRSKLAPDSQPTKVADPAVATMLVAPLTVGTASGPLEVSVHRLGPKTLRELPAVVPDAPFGRPVVAVVTFQFAQLGVNRALQADSFSDPPTAAQAAWQAEMDRMLTCFTLWATAVRSVLARQRRWCDAIDPCSGVPLWGAAGGRAWSEVAAVGALLGYSTSAHGVCPVVHHPVHGSAAYPATLLTDATLEQLQQALSEVAAGASPPQPPPQWTHARPLLSLRDVTYTAPSGLLCAERLSMDVAAGQAVLIEGPSGCGKSTLLRALGGLHPLDSGRVWLSPPDQVMFLPQSAVTPPGASLADQLSYGAARRWGNSDMRRALHQVGLSHLLQRVDGDWDAHKNWTGQLSVGEVQRLAIARVLLRSPALVIMDEATSALGDAMTTELYGLIKASGAAILSFGQCQSSLRELHDAVLALIGRGHSATDGSSNGSWHWLRDGDRTASEI